MSELEYKTRLRNIAHGTRSKHEVTVHCDGFTVDVVMGPYVVSVEFDKRDGEPAGEDVLSVGVYSADDVDRADPLMPHQVFPLPTAGPGKVEPEGAPFARCPRCDMQQGNGLTAHTLLECFQELSRRLRVLEDGAAMVIGPTSPVLEK